MRSSLFYIIVSADYGAHYTSPNGLSVTPEDDTYDCWECDYECRKKATKELSRSAKEVTRLLAQQQSSAH